MFGLIGKKFDSISVEDFQSLIDNEVSEGRTTEYKSELNIDSGDEKKEFLADVSSFANTDGGDLIFGIQEAEDTHTPCNLCGIQIDNVENLILKLESMFRDSFQPRIPDIQIKAIPISVGNSLLLIRIPRSYRLPHRIIYRGYDRFFKRNAKGKYPMDVDELRASFLQAHELSKQIDEYKTATISEIVENRYRYLHDGFPIFIMQAIPISAFLQNSSLTATSIHKAVQDAQLRPFNFNHGGRITVDGVFYGKTVSSDDYPGMSAYMFCKTNGIIEIACTHLFDPSIGENKDKIIYRDELVAGIIKSVEKIIVYYKITSIAPPILFSCAIAKGYGFTIPTGHPLRSAYGHIDRELLLVPGTTIEDLSMPVSDMLRPILDSIWNACGYSRCNNYDETGRFIMPQ